MSKPTKPARRAEGFSSVPQVFVVCERIVQPQRGLLKKIRRSEDERCPIDRRYGSLWWEALRKYRREINKGLSVLRHREVCRGRLPDQSNMQKLLHREEAGVLLSHLSVTSAYPRSEDRGITHPSGQTFTVLVE